MRDDEFEWDDIKAAQTLADHKARFATARLAFADHFAHVREDLRENYDEEMYTIIAMARQRLLRVADTHRGE